jgi:hypothetical protein
MARPPLPLGEHGEISIAPKRGQWVARCRFRGFDGVTRKVERWGKSRTAARLTLQDQLRTQRGERTEMLRPESRFREAADMWMGKIRQRRAGSTADTYDHCLQSPSHRSTLTASAPFADHRRRDAAACGGAADVQQRHPARLDPTRVRAQDRGRARCGTDEVDNQVADLVTTYGTESGDIGGHGT